MDNRLRQQLQYRICNSLTDHRGNEGDGLASILESRFNGFRNMDDQSILDMFMRYFEDPEGDGTPIFDEVHQTAEYREWQRSHPKTDSRYRVSFDVYKEGTIPGALGNKILSALQDYGIEALSLECKVVE